MQLPADMIPTKLSLLTEWYRKKELLRLIQGEERELRAQVVSAFGDPNAEIGTQTIALEAGWKLKIKKSLDYKLDNTEGAVELFQQDCPADVFNRVVKWNPSLIVDGYKALSEQEQKAFSEILTIKPAAIQVELVKPGE